MTARGQSASRLAIGSWREKKKRNEEERKRKNDDKKVLDQPADGAAKGIGGS